MLLFARHKYQPLSRNDRHTFFPFVSGRGVVSKLLSKHRRMSPFLNLLIGWWISGCFVLHYTSGIWTHIRLTCLTSCPMLPLKLTAWMLLRSTRSGRPVDSHNRSMCYQRRMVKEATCLERLFIVLLNVSYCLKCLKIFLLSTSYLNIVWAQEIDKQYTHFRVILLPPQLHWHCYMNEKP